MEEKQNPEEPVRQKPVRQKPVRKKMSSTPPWIQIMAGRDPFHSDVEFMSGCSWLLVIGTVIGIFVLLFTCSGILSNY